MLLEHGTQTRLIKETTAGAGITSKYVSTATDTVLVTLWCEAASGDLTLTIYSGTDDEDTNKETVSIVFPTVSAPTTTLLLRRASVTTQRVRVEATYTGAVNYEVYVRAINAGLVDTRIIGASSLRMSQADVTTTPAVLVPSALTDRGGIVIKNWSNSGTMFLGATAGEADVNTGWPLAPKDALAIDLAAGAEVWAVSDAGTLDARISEAGG